MNEAGKGVPSDSGTLLHLGQLTLLGPLITIGIPEARSGSTEVINERRPVVRRGAGGGGGAWR